MGKISFTLTNLQNIKNQLMRDLHPIKGTIILILGLLFVSVLNGQDNRPQEPKGPFDYNSEDIVFQNSFDSVSLAGTFTYPKTGSDFPSVILISGSGPQDRNSELLNHKPFWVIADELTKNGIAVLRVDDRGTGESEGDYNSTGLAGFVNDTKSALDYLNSREEISKSKIGLVGHSMGGLIAPVVASESDLISFIVLLAAPGIRGDSLMLLQKETMERRLSYPEFAIAMNKKNIKGAYEIILQAKRNDEDLESQLNKYFTKVFGAVLPEDQIVALSTQLSFPWFADFIRFDPTNSLSKTKCPVLAINGGNDFQVPAKENLSAIKRILKESNNDDVEVFEMEKLNHLFQESETGLMNEYMTIEQTFSPDVIDIIHEWILKKTN